MTTPGATSANFAGNAHGFVQAQVIHGNATNFDVSSAVVHGDLRFELPPGATAADKFRAGIYNLTSGMAPEARKLIWEAMMGGCQTSSARFHWLIAMLSGRTFRQFTYQEIEQLKAVDRHHPGTVGDPWDDGSQLIFQLLASVGLVARDPRPDIRLTIKGFDSLGAAQRDMLLPHLELFLEGPLKDDIWLKERSAAEEKRLSGDRASRAWMFFQPVPAEPRGYQPQPVTTTPAERLVAWTSTVVLTVSVGIFAWDLLRHGAVLGLLALVAALTGSAVAAPSCLEVRFLAERRRRLEARLRAPTRSQPKSPRNGLAAKVDALFNRYAAKYIPDRDERAAWDAAAAGVRTFDRDEIVAGCRESGATADEVAWLVRYRIRQSRDKWRAGKLYDQVKRLRPNPRTVATSHAGLAVAVLGGAGAIVTLGSDPLLGVASVVVLSASGIWAWRNWLHIVVERRRFTADAEESNQRTEEANEEYRRWSRRLERSPNDAEMAAWLDYDRTVLLGRAIDHYKLARHQVITHAFLEEPGDGAKRARVRNGPMRYSRYTLIVFLLTSDGVRQLWADLGFLLGRVTEGNRLSYRYDAVASAHVKLIPRLSRTSRIQQRFTLTLVNGEPIDVMVADLDPEDFQQGEDARLLNRASLEAASVTNTLHVLEGIAAEGKGWFQTQKPGHGWAAV